MNRFHCAELQRQCSIQSADRDSPAVSQSDELWLVHCETAAQSSQRHSGDHPVGVPRWSMIAVARRSINASADLRNVSPRFLVLNEGPQSSHYPWDQPCKRATRSNAVARIQAFREHERVNVAIVFAEAADESRVQRLIVFGDSLSDTEHLDCDRLRVLVDCHAKPQILDPGLAEFSNGPMWPDYIDALSKLIGAKSRCWRCFSDG